MGLDQVGTHGTTAALALLNDAVKKGGVNTEGVEDQLVGAAQAACQGDGVTVPAVAGQLIEQGRSELSHEQLIQLITERGRALCAQ